MEEIAGGIAYQIGKTLPLLLIVAIFWGIGRVITFLTSGKVDGAVSIPDDGSQPTLRLEDLRGAMDSGERGDAIAIIDSAKKFLEEGMSVGVKENGELIRVISSVDEIELFKEEVTKG